MAVETVAAPILPEYVGLPSHLDAESSAQGSRVYMASIALLEGGRSVSTWGYSVNLAADEKEASQEGGVQQAPAASLPTTPVAPVDHVTTGSDVSPSKTGDTGRAVIVTTTYARYNRNWEVVRANCVLKTVAAAAEHGYSIVTADGGSPPGYIEEMQRLGAHVFAQKEPGMGNARREALRHALATAKD